MEEIIGYIPWLKHNQKFLEEKYPAIMKLHMKKIIAITFLPFLVGCASNSVADNRGEETIQSFAAYETQGMTVEVETEKTEDISVTEETLLQEYETQDTATEAESGETEEIFISKEMLLQQDALSIWDILNKHFNHRYPANYVGCYISGADLVVLISDNDYSEFEFLSEYDNVRFESVEYSSEELRAVLEDVRQWLAERNVMVLKSGTSLVNNVAEFTISEETDEEVIAELTEYIQDLPVTIIYMDKNSYPQLQ